MAKSETVRAADKAARLARRAAQIAADEAETKNDTPAAEEATDLANLLASLPNTADIRLYRKAKIGGRLEFCQSFLEASEFSEEGVADKWGPGTYRLMVRVPDKVTGKPNFMAGGTKTFTVAERPGEAARGGAGTRGPENFQETMAAQMFTMMTSQLGMMQQMMMQSAESHRGMLTMMLSNKPPDTTGELLKVLLPLVLNKADPMDMAIKMAELLKPAGPGASMVEQLAVLEKFMDLAKSGNEPNDAPVWFRALKEVAPLLERAMTLKPGALQPGQPPAAQLAPGAPPPAPAPAPAPVPAPALPPPTQVDPAQTAGQPLDLLTELDQLMPMLVRAAVKNADVELQADWFLEAVPEGLYETLDVALAETNLLDQLALRYPSIATHRAWFDRFVAAVNTALTPEEEAEVAE